MKKRFYKSTIDKKISGVCGGIAEYFNMDPTIVRFIWVLAAFAWGASIWVYIILAIVMPNDNNMY